MNEGYESDPEPVGAEFDDAGYSSAGYSSDDAAAPPAPAGQDVEHEVANGTAVSAKAGLDVAVRGHHELNLPGPSTHRDTTWAF